MTGLARTPKARKSAPYETASLAGRPGEIPRLEYIM